MFDEPIEKQSDAPSDAAVEVTPEVSGAPAEQAMHGALQTKDSGSSELRGFAIGVMGWIIPGLGHALLKMWGRAIAIFLAVGFLVYLGAGMRGNLFSPGGDDAFTRLGFAADLGTGGFYLLARSWEPAGADVSHAYGDYGTRFLATAGVLNLLAALHAYEAARGRKA